MESLYDSIGYYKCPNCSGHFTIEVLPIYYNGRHCRHYCQSCGHRW